MEISTFVNPNNSGQAKIVVKEGNHYLTLTLETHGDTIAIDAIDYNKTFELSEHGELAFVKMMQKARRFTFMGEQCGNATFMDQYGDCVDIDIFTHKAEGPDADKLLADLKKYRQSTGKYPWGNTPEPEETTT